MGRAKQQRVRDSRKNVDQELSAESASSRPNSVAHIPSPRRSVLDRGDQTGFTPRDSSVASARSWCRLFRREPVREASQGPRRSAARASSRRRTVGVRETTRVGAARIPGRARPARVPRDVKHISGTAAKQRVNAVQRIFACAPHDVAGGAKICSAIRVPWHRPRASRMRR